MYFALYWYFKITGEKIDVREDPQSYGYGFSCFKFSRRTKKSGNWKENILKNLLNSVDRWLN